jgi:hypothetical protein
MRVTTIHFGIAIKMYVWQILAAADRNVVRYKNVWRCSRLHITWKIKEYVVHFAHCYIRQIGWWLVANKGRDITYLTIVRGFLEQRFSQAGTNGCSITRMLRLVGVSVVHRSMMILSSACCLWNEACFISCLGEWKRDLLFTQRFGYHSCAPERSAGPHLHFNVV